jgi:hypothetical protein
VSDDENRDELDVAIKRARAWIADYDERRARERLDEVVGRLAGKYLPPKRHLRLVPDATPDPDD